MSAPALSVLLIIAVLAVLVPVTGRYLAAVYGGELAPGDRVFAPVERAVYRLCGIDASSSSKRGPHTSIVWGQSQIERFPRVPRGGRRGCAAMTRWGCCRHGARG